MSNEEDKKTVGELRAYYEQQIKRFQEKLHLLESLQADARILTVPKDKYRDMGLTEAILDAVVALVKSGTQHLDGVEAYDVLLFLNEHGFRGTETLPTSIHTTLKRLSAAHDGRVIMTKDKYFKRRYKPGEKILRERLAG